MGYEVTGDETADGYEVTGVELADGYETTGDELVLVRSDRLPLGQYLKVLLSLGQTKKIHT